MTSELREKVLKNRFQLISAAGLAVLFVAIATALQQGVVSPLQTAALGVLPFTIGVAIGHVRRWSALSWVATSGALVCLAVTAYQGTPSGTLLVGLALLLTVSVLGLWRQNWIGPTALALLGSVGLLTLLHVAAIISSIQTLCALVATWGLTTFASALQQLEQRPRSAAVFSLGGSLGILVAGLICFGPSANLAGLSALLLVIQGVLALRLPHAEGRLGTILLVTSTFLGVLAVTVWFGLIGLALGLGGLACFAIRRGRNSHSVLFSRAALLAFAIQALAMLAAHPSLAWLPQGNPGAWSWLSWSICSLIAGLQLTLAWWSWPVDGIPVTRMQRVAHGLMALGAAYILVALSTLLSALVAWAPLLTVLWTAAGALLWILGRHNQGLRITAAAAVFAAMAKLVVVDWSILSLSTRFVLLLMIGTTMLVVPLFASDGTEPKEKARDQAKGPDLMQVGCAVNSTPDSRG